MALPLWFLSRWVSSVCLAAAVVLISGCAPAAPAPAAPVIRTTMPPWDAPRDAVSYIEATGLEVLASGYLATSQTVAQLLVTIDGQEVEVPAYVGIDRVRNVEAPLHTHQDDGTIWVEHPREAPETTVGEFFDLWGVRFDERCVGAACTGLTVRVDGKPIPADQDPRAIEWTTDLVVQIDARS